MRRRTKRIDLHLSCDEASRLQELTALTGYTTSALLRAMIMGYRLKERPSADILELNRQLLRIGVNLDQIAAKANARGLLDAPYYTQQAKELAALRTELYKKLLMPEKVTDDTVLEWLEEGGKKWQ